MWICRRSFSQLVTSREYTQGPRQRERETKVFWRSLGDPEVGVLHATPTENVHGSRDISEDILYWESVAKNCEGFLLFGLV